MGTFIKYLLNLDLGQVFKRSPGSAIDMIGQFLLHKLPSQLRAGVRIFCAQPLEEPKPLTCPPAEHRAETAPTPASSDYDHNWEGIFGEERAVPTVPLAGGEAARWLSGRAQDTRAEGRSRVCQSDTVFSFSLSSAPDLYLGKPAGQQATV